MPTTYYVATAGSNSNNGTSTGTPFLTFAKAVTVAIAGDTILLNGGDTFTENVSIAVALASLSSYGTGLGTVVSTSATVTTIIFTAVPAAVTNLNIQSTTSAYPNSGAQGMVIITTGATVVSGCTISGCNFSSIPGVALYLSHTSADNGGMSNISVTGNTFNNIGVVAFQSRNSVATFGSNFNFSGLTFSGNTISNVLGNTSSSGNVGGWGITLQCVNTSAGASSVHDNVFHDLGANANSALAGGGTAFQCEGCSGLQVYNNVAYNLFNTNLSGDGGEGFDIDVVNTNVVVYNNYVFNSDGAALACYSTGGTYTGNVFRNNIGVNVARNTIRGGIFVSGTSPYVFYNNTIVTYGAQPALTWFPGAVYTATILNNILISSAGVPSTLIPASTSNSGSVDGNYQQSGDGLFLCTNATGTSFTTLAGWQGNTGWETAGVAAGHMHFVQPRPAPTTLTGAAALSPVAGAPVINAGANLLGTYGITPAADFRGNAWTQNSIGAIYVAGSPTAYAAALYALNPLSWYRLAEPSGAAGGDSIGTFQDLVYSSVTLGGATLAKGDGSPTSAAWNGTSSMATGVLSAHTFALTSLSVIFAITPSTVSVANQSVVGVVDVSGTPFNEVTARVSLTTLVFVLKDASTGNVNANYAAGLVAGNTYFVVLTWTGTTQTCYVNGGSALTPTYTSTVALSGGLPLKQPTIGFFNPTIPSQWFNGPISSVALVPAVITQAQSAALYAAFLSSIRARRSLSDRAGTRGVA